MRVGILFRGPLRPNVDAVIKNTGNFLDFFKQNKIKGETWLSTWNTHLGKRVIDELPNNIFDNVISLVEPDDNQAMNMWGGLRAVRTGQTTNRIWKAMLSSRIALDAMVQTNKFDYIIHARTDGVYDLGVHLKTWFRDDSVGTKHVEPFINDMLNIGPAKLVAGVYQYKSVEDLGDIIKNIHCPEEILMQIANRNGIKWHEAKYNKVWVDEDRNVGDPMK